MLTEQEKAWLESRPKYPPPPMPPASNLRGQRLAEQAAKQAERLENAADVPRIRGLGDVVAKVAEVTGIKAATEYMNGGKPCGGCEKRREALNRAVPFKSE